MPAALWCDPTAASLLNTHTGAAAPGTLGYLRVATFNSNTAQAVQDALQSLHGQSVDGLVLDVRNNGGGLFPAGVYE